MHRAYIGYGSNLGNRERNIHAALSFLSAYAIIVKNSSFYETEPVDCPFGGPFLNGAVQIMPHREPIEILEVLQEIELKLGRTRGVKNCPRTIDLDLLFYDHQIINKRELILPHPRLHERIFVLEPLNEIAPVFVHPFLKKTIRELLEEVKNGQIYQK